MADETVHDDHGHSPAGWVGAVVIIVGACLIGLGIGLGHQWMWIAGWAAVALGAIAGFVLSRAGFGHKRLAKPMDHDEWVAAQHAGNGAHVPQHTR